MENNEIIYAPVEIEDLSQLESLGITWKDVTYYKVGLKFIPVYLVPANEATREFLLKELNRKYANPDRDSRCLVPGVRRDYIRCRSSLPCRECPHGGERQYYNPALISLEDMLEEGGEPEDESFSLDLIVELHEILEKIRECSPVYYKAVVMKAAGYREEEISKALGISPSSVHRAIVKTRELANCYGGEEPAVPRAGVSEPGPSFQERVRQLRKEKGLTQSGLAEMMGVTKGTVCTWETGSRVPGSGTLFRLCELFGVSLDYLTGRE